MMRINLLPHRELKRAAKQRYFAVLAGIFGAIGLGIWFVGHTVLLGYSSAQQEKNKFLIAENAKLDKEIEEIKKLKDEIAALLARKQVIETLQADRTVAVYIFDELTRQTPQGIYLKSIAQKGSRITLNGYAQSQARVSTLMRNIESSPWLEAPQLIEIKSIDINKRRSNEFILDLSPRRPKVEEYFTKGSTASVKPGASSSPPAEASKK